MTLCYAFVFRAIWQHERRLRVYRIRGRIPARIEYATSANSAADVLNEQEGGDELSSLQPSRGSDDIQELQPIGSSRLRDEEDKVGPSVDEEGKKALDNKKKARRGKSKSQHSKADRRVAITGEFYLTI